MTLRAVFRCALVAATLGPFLACGGGGGGSASSSGGSPTPPPPPPPPSGPTVQVALNGGFESTSPLAWGGDTGVIQSAPGSSNPAAVPHGGSLFAWLSGYGSAATDTVYQDLFVPGTATSAQATFWLKIITAETGSTAKDTFTVQARTPGNVVLGTLLTKSNLDAASTYAQFTVDLLPYKGQVVRLAFVGTEDAANATSFLVDDVAVNIAVPTPTDLQPIIDSFSPGSGVMGETPVTLRGRNFFGVTTVTLGGQSAAFTLTDGTLLTATVPASAAAGSAPIGVTNAQGTGNSASNFTCAFGTPTGTANPTQGPVGTPVVISGTYLGYAGTTVTFNGTAATPSSQSATQLVVAVPPGATTGNLVVTTPGGTVSQPFTVNAASTSLDLHVERIQLTQSTQTLGNAVPVLAGKDGLLRVFVLANQANTVAPSVQVTLKNNGVAVAGYPKNISAPGASVPTAINEGVLTASWNLAIPGTDLTTPVGSGYSVEATVDPTHAIAQADTTNDTTTVTLGGTTVPVFRTTLFPVVLSSGTGNATAGNAASWVAKLKAMYPIADVDIAVGAAFTGSVSTLQSDGTGWDTLLNDLTAKHLADGTAGANRYYYGALKVSYGGGVAGLGWVPGSSSAAPKYRTAIGWDKTGYGDGGDYPWVYAHETGHNMGRPHSPCGGAGNPDPAYPYTGGLIGVWGYDSVNGVLKDPSVVHDIMGYCSPNWVSDYVYTKVLQFRAGTGGFLTGTAPEEAPLKAGSARECLLVRGVVHEDGSVAFLPAFRTEALPSAAPAESEWTVEGLDAEGHPLFTASLELMELGCGPRSRDRHFVMALPLEASALDALNALQVRRRGELVAHQRSLFGGARVVPAAGPEARRLAPGSLALSWDASVHPAALVRDADTREVIAILQGGAQTLPTGARRLEVVLSDGVRSRTQALEVQP